MPGCAIFISVLPLGKIVLINACANSNHPQVSAYLVADVVADGILRDHAISGKRQMVVKF